MIESAKKGIIDARKALRSNRAELAQLTNGVDLDTQDIMKRHDIKQYRSDKDALLGFNELMSITRAQKGIANSEAAYENGYSFRKYAECAYKNNLPATITQEARLKTGITRFRPAESSTCPVGTKKERFPLTRGRRES